MALLGLGEFAAQMQRLNIQAPLAVLVLWALWGQPWARGIAFRSIGECGC